MNLASLGLPVRRLAGHLLKLLLFLSHHHIHRTRLGKGLAERGNNGAFFHYSFSKYDRGTAHKGAGLIQDIHCFGVHFPGR